MVFDSTSRAEFLGSLALGLLHEKVCFCLCRLPVVVQRGLVGRAASSLAL